MTKLLYSTAVAAMLLVSPAAAEANAKPWCERSEGHTAFCVLGGVIAFIVVASMSPDNDRDHRAASAPQSDGGRDTDFARAQAERELREAASAEPTTPDYPDWSQSDGCAWGSRDYDTCH